MQTVVGIKFRSGNKVYYFNPNGIELEVNDTAIVETVNGIEYGTVKLSNKDVDDKEIVSPLKNVVRKATVQDLKQIDSLSKKEDYAFTKASEIIAEKNMNMKLVGVEYTFDGKKAVFYYTADNRVDFRELVKVLAGIFHIRIEMHQLNEKEDIKYHGALGPCGRPCCCTTFLNGTDKVTLKMAKNQNLSLNPTKINGMCGRLMCCIKFENDFYVESAEKMPSIRSMVNTPDGSGTVQSVNIFKETVKVRIEKEDGSETKDYPLEKITKTENQQ